MAISIRWMDGAKTVLLVDYDCPWDATLAKRHPSDQVCSSQLQQHIQAKIAEVPHTVDTLIDFTHAHGAVPIQTLTHLRRTARTRPPNMGTTLFISNQDTISRLIELMRRSSPALARHSTLTRTRSDALTVLEIIRRNRAHVR